jgi:hypothetical protein
MNGDVHVRFCESLGLQRPGPLTKKAKAKAKAKRKGTAQGKAKK